MSFWSFIMEPLRRMLATGKPRSVVGTDGVLEPLPPVEVPTTPDGTPLSTFADWVWPLPEINGNHPMVSDGFGVNKRFNEEKKAFLGHFGADIMWPRRAQDATARETTAADGGRAKNFFIYEGAPAICCGPGRVFSAEPTTTGVTVKVSHHVSGRPFLTVYRHLKNSLVEKGQVVAAGSPLGLIGDNPASKKDPPHLHFEIWDVGKGGGYPAWNIDPMSVASVWRTMESSGAIVAYRGNTRFLKGSRGPVGTIVLLLGSGLLLSQILQSRRF